MVVSRAARNVPIHIVLMTETLSSSEYVLGAAVGGGTLSSVGMNSDALGSPPCVAPDMALKALSCASSASSFSACSCSGAAATSGVRSVLPAAMPTGRKSGAKATSVQSHAFFPTAQSGSNHVYVRATHPPTPLPLLHPRHARQMSYNTCLHSHIVIHIHGDFDFLTRLKRRHAQEGA